METIKGKIENKDMSIGETNGKSWTKTTYTIDSKFYSTFDKKISDEFQVGDVVKMEGEQNGKYWNMKTMERASDKVSSVSEGVPKVSSRATPRGSDDITATELIRYSVKLAESKPDGDFSTICANVFEEFQKFKNKLNGN